MMRTERRDGWWYRGLAAWLLVVSCSSPSSGGGPAAVNPSSGAVAASARSQAELASARATPVASPQQSPAISLAALDALFDPTGASAAAAAEASRGRPDPLTYRQWVRSRLADPIFYEVLVPALIDNMLFLGPPWIISPGGELHEAKGRRGTFYYRAKQCAERDLQRVRPWWEPAKEAWICRDDYLPKVLVSSTGVNWCDQSDPPLPERSGCGCGPQLMFCAPAEVKEAVDDAISEELNLTFQYVVQSERPFGDLLTMNPTVRSGYADFFLARVAFFLTGTFVPPDVTKPATLKPRSEVYQGGILSTPTFLFSDSQRTAVDAIWNDFLCYPLHGEGVETAKILDALRSSTNLRGQPHMALTQTLGCQNCHARLEHAQNAFGGWQSKYQGTHFIPPDAKAIATAKLFVRNHRDLRTEGPANLGWLGKAIASQPDFNECTVSRIATFVYEGAKVPYEVERALVSRFETGQHLGQLIEDAVVARAFGLAGLRAAAASGERKPP